MIIQRDHFNWFRKMVEWWKKYEGRFTIWM